MKIFYVIDRYVGESWVLERIFKTKEVEIRHLKILENLMEMPLATENEI